MTNTHKELYDWMTGGGAATCMALLMVSMTIETNNHVELFMAQSLLLFGIFGLAATYSIAKMQRGFEAQLFGRARQEHTSPAEAAYIAAMIFGLLGFVLGFATLLMVLNKMLMVPFMVGLTFTLTVYSKAHTAVLKHKVKHDDKDNDNRS